MTIFDTFETKSNVFTGPNGIPMHAILMIYVIDYDINQIGLKCGKSLKEIM